MEGDGSVVCAQCRTKLNESDANCWRCGGRDLRPVLVEPAPIVFDDLEGL